MQLAANEKERLLKKYGPWAIITGASSGIGFELAKQLADTGFNLLIHARSSSRLETAAEYLQSRYPVTIKVIAADVSETDGIDKIIRSTQHIQVGLLIVSAGYGTGGLFYDSSLHTETNMLKVNCMALLSITHYFSQRFVQQKRGGIILMSSLVAFQGVPYSANYAATKAYVQSLAEALAVELKTHGVDVLAAAPGPVRSSFGKRANMRMGMALNPSDIGVPILKALGRKTTVLPGFLTKVLVYSLRTVPRWAKVRIMKLVMGGMTKHQRTSA